MSAREGAEFVCGIDIGGTFTDCAVVDGSGAIITAKVPSTPSQPAEAFVNGLSSAAEKMGIELKDLLARSSQVMHGTTIATNVAVQERGAKVGLLATAGHGEAILHMRGAGRTTGVPIERMLDIPASYKPKPIVPRNLIEEVTERIDSSGEVVVPLDEAQAAEAIDRLLAQGVESIAISLLWSFFNPEHERRLKEMVEERAAGMYVSASSEIVPVIGEYERTVATALNSYVGPATQDYLNDLRGRLGEADFDRDVLIVEQTGGVVPAPRAGGEAVLTLGSGPVAGLIGTRFLAEEIGIQNVIAVDMGGTSFDIGLVRDGRPVTSDLALVDQYQYYTSNVDVRSIGAGGGSIASVDPISGGLLVGPESAGAVPGPACYSRGGDRATVTDADVVLGYLDPEYFLGGEMSLDVAAAEKVVDEIAAASGLSRIEAAAGIAKVVEFRMADLIRATTVERGFDPRDFALFVYGGAGATHGVVLARELGIDTVVVPMGNAAGVWSALGAATSDVLFVSVASEPQAAPFDGEALTTAYETLEGEALKELDEQGFSGDQVTLERRASVRYRYQIHEIEIAVPGGKLGPEEAAGMLESFERSYAELYGEGTGYSAAGFELTNVKVLASGHLTRPSLAAAAAGSDGAAERHRDIYSAEDGGYVKAAVLTGSELAPGRVIEGPAVVELDFTTVVIQPYSTGKVDDIGNLIIKLEEVQS